jgi:glycosyltransferase involved in cell wall biosynthesis
LNVLYYAEPELHAGSRGGGVSMVAYHLTKALANQARVTYFPSYVVSQRSYPVNLLKVYSRFARRDFEIIHFNLVPEWINGGYMLLRFAKMTGAATLLNIHGIIQVEYLMDHPRTRKFRSTMEKTLMSTLRSCRHVDQVVTYSGFMRNQIVTWYGVSREKIAVIPNGVNLKKFSDCTGKLLLEGDPAILYVGYLSKFKSVDLLICAISKLRSELPNMKLHIVGHGNQTALELLAKKKQVEKIVVFHGQANPEAVPLYYRSADFCVFPSRRDSAGLTLLEAMASGTPVIASNRGGTPEIITQGKNGILFEPDDANALPEAMLSLSQDTDLKKKLSSNALKTAANYSWEKIAEKYISLYKYLCE